MYYSTIMGQEQFSEPQKQAIRAYYLENRSTGGIIANAMGEMTDEFDPFSEPPRVGALNALERWRSDLVEITRKEMHTPRSEFF